MAEPLFRRLTLIGVGLIGSSVARIARERGDIAGEIVVNARTAKTLDRVRDRLTDFSNPASGSFYFAPSVETLNAALK